MDKTILFKSYRKAITVNKDFKILEICKDRNVLDVGCVGQDSNYDSDSWLHKKISNVSNSLYGVDINQAGIDTMIRKDFKVLHFDQLIEASLKFEVIIMADVIEHVNEPVDFLYRYSKFLDDNGSIVVTTPNSNRGINFITILLSNDYNMNLEHTIWLCPKTFTEIVSRAELKITQFYWVSQYYDFNSLKFLNKIKFSFAYLLSRFRSNFNHNFMFVLTK